MNPKRRWNNGNGYKTQVFYRAIQKYGWNNFEHKILFKGLTKAEAEKKEIELISLYQSNNPKYGYNVDNGGNTTGTHSEITRRKLSNYMMGDTRNRGRIHTEESKRHMSESHKGNKLSESTKKKLSDCNLGKKYSQEIIENIKQSKRQANGISIYCIELDIVFNSLAEAVEYIDNIDGTVLRQGIQKALRGSIKTSGKLKDGTKLHWKYAYWR